MRHSKIQFIRLDEKDSLHNLAPHVFRLGGVRGEDKAILFLSVEYYLNGMRRSDMVSPHASKGGSFRRS